jgi:hypothetical protein
MRSPVLIVAIWCCVGCAHQGSIRPARSANAPVLTSGGTFTYEKAGIELSWPSGWKQVDCEECKLKLVPQSTGDASQWVTLDVPDLPIHVPGLIPIVRVESGYLDDLRKQYGTIETTELTPPVVPDSKARFVRAAWSESGQKVQQTALVLVHADYVYIIRGRSGVDQEQEMRECLDRVVQSLRWIPVK